MSDDEDGFREGRSARAAGVALRLSRISAAGDGSVWGLDVSGTLLGNTEDVVSWQKRPAPAPLVSVGSASDGAVYAVDEDGVFYAYRDEWARVGQVSDGRLVSVSVGAAGTVWGVDAHGRLLTYDAATQVWSPVAAPLGGAVARCAATLDGSVFCLTAQGAVYLRRGTDWVPLPGDGPFMDVAAAEAGWVWGVTSVGGLAQYDGQTWQKVGGPGGAAVSRVACGTDLTVWAVDASGRLFQFDSAHDAWLPIAPPVALADVALGGIASAWALGVDRNAYQYTRTASVWGPAGVDGVYSEIAAVDADVLWALDVKQHVVRLTRAGDAWSVVAEPSGPVRLAAGHDGSIWGVGKDGTVLGFDRSAALWRPLPKPPAPAVRVSAGDAASVTALDAAGTVHQYAPDAGAWSTLGEQAPATGFTDVSALPGGSVYAVARTGEIYLYLGVWVRGGGKAVAISAADATNVWALDAAGDPVHLPGGSSEGTQGTGPDLPGWDAEDVFDEVRSTHLWIVNRAIKLAAAAGGPVGAWLDEVLHPGAGRLGDPLHDNMCQGLYDADFVPPYNNVVQGHATWASHFYDPASGRNWLRWDNPTALTQGIAYFEQSVEAYLQGRLDGSGGAGYRLGLALHYMTDVTQPMHSNNFTWLSSFLPGFHGDYEAYILEFQSSEGFRPQAFDIPRLGAAPGSYIEAAAWHSRAYLDKIVPPDVYIAYTNFTRAHAGLAAASAPALLGYAIAATAGFLLAWGDQTYRRPKEWQDFGQPAPGVTATVGIGATSVDGRPYLFVKGSDDNLWVCWDRGNSDWQWSSGEYPAPVISSGIGAGTSSYGPAVFMLDVTGAVLARWWENNTETWHWTDLGMPPALGGGSARITSSAVAALPAVDTAVFVGTDQGTLFKNQVPTSQWEQVQPPQAGRTVTAVLGATVVSGQRCVLVTTDDGQLWVWTEQAYANGTWALLTPPPSGRPVTKSLGVAPHVAFVLCDDGQVWFCQWDLDGFGAWLGFGQPPDDQTIVGGLTVNTAPDPFYQPWLMGLTREGPLLLGGLKSDGLSPVWDDRAEPGRTSIASTVGFVPYQRDFLTAVVGADGHIWA